MFLFETHQINSIMTSKSKTRVLLVRLYFNTATLYVKLFIKKNSCLFIIINLYQSVFNLTKLKKIKKRFLFID